MAHSIEMREPFLDLKLIRLSMKIDSRLNVKGVSDAFGKHVHRKLAQELGIPRDIAYRSKEAAQHGSGIHQVIDLIARKHGFDESTISTKYMDLLKSRERVGSSQRYGYLFEDEKKKMWIAEPHVQMYLDSISKRLPALEQSIVAKETPMNNGLVICDRFNCLMNMPGNSGFMTLKGISIWLLKRHAIGKEGLSRMCYSCRLDHYSFG
jgi:hypothetical protein